MCEGGEGGFHPRQAVTTYSSGRLDYISGNEDVDERENITVTLRQEKNDTFSFKMIIETINTTASEMEGRSRV